MWWVAFDSIVQFQTLSYSFRFCVDVIFFQEAEESLLSNTFSTKPNTTESGMNFLIFSVRVAYRKLDLHTNTQNITFSLLGMGSKVVVLSFSTKTFSAGFFLQNGILPP